MWQESLCIHILSQKVEKLEKGIFIQGFDVLGFVTVEDIPQVNVKQGVEERFETEVRGVLHLNNSMLTNDE